MKPKYFFQSAFVECAIAEMKEDDAWAKLEAVLPLESFFSIAKKVQMTSCHIDFVGDVRYGSNEGIVGALYIDGRGTYSHTCVALARTLSSDKESFLRMGQLVTLLAYHANRLVEENIDRFD